LDSVKKLSESITKYNRQAFLSPLKSRRWGSGSFLAGIESGIPEGELVRPEERCDGATDADEIGRLPSGYAKKRLKARFSKSPRKGVSPSACKPVRRSLMAKEEPMPRSLTRLLLSSSGNKTSPMKPRFQAITTILVVLGVIGFFGTFIWEKRSQHDVREDLSKLDPSNVESLVVFEADYPRGEEKSIFDRSKIEALLLSLQAGKSYFPTHDQQNGFERFIILKPQNIALSVYQKGSSDSPIIVKPGYWRNDQDYSTYGYLSCSPPDSWKSL
jgi:hypothetical protein